MLIFSTFLLYLFIGNGVLSYIRPLFLFLVVTALILSIWRVSLAEAIHLPSFRRQAVVVGVNTPGKRIAREILSAKHPAVNVLGWIGEMPGRSNSQARSPGCSGKDALQRRRAN